MTLIMVLIGCGGSEPDVGGAAVDRSPDDTEAAGPPSGSAVPGESTEESDTDTGRDSESGESGSDTEPSDEDQSAVADSSDQGEQSDPPPGRPVALALDPLLNPQDASLGVVSAEQPIPFTSDPCRALATIAQAGPAVRCGATPTLAWQVVVSGNGRKEVTIYRVDGGELQPVLRAVDEKGFAWESVAVQAADLTADGVAELVVGMRQAGSGSFLDVDVVANDGQVVMHRSLDHGEAGLYFGVYTDFRADFAEDEPNCCPSAFIRESVVYQDGRWQIIETERIDTDQVDAGLF